MTHEPDTGPDDVEVLDGLPVLGADSEQAPLQGREPPGTVAVVPSRQVAALAAGGFVAGAAAVALVHRRRTKALARQLRRRKGRAKSPFGEVVSSNSFLVDVHLLRRD